ncbi:hypothetical protein NX794_10465 [Streptomyces sp. LP11]|uniref:Secreted protein n=1 Tax=Streptomyces pyxinicus TaxID=2970331 RepID=A0ABT2AZG2_9ACTN|nr:hypothetical protein [Streptomyces sp. LP11]MCS0601634.1 hypothetical protein [Streptomyces sp. LP11]
MPCPAGGRPPDPRKLRLLALVGVVAAAVALPLTVASAGQVGDAGRTAVRTPPRAPERADAKDLTAKDLTAKDLTAEVSGAEGLAAAGAVGKGPVAGRRSPLLLGVGLATAARCGPQLTSPEGIEAQTCVLIQGADTWARTYYRNATGRALDSVLSLMGPGGRTVQMRCATGADDEPATCETPREHSRGGPDGYTAVSEFAGRGADEALLLRSGSNS